MQSKHQVCFEPAKVFSQKGSKGTQTQRDPRTFFLFLFSHKPPLLGDGCGHQEGSDRGEGQLQRLQVWRPHYKYCCCEHQSFKLQWSLPSFCQSVCRKNVKMCPLVMRPTKVSFQCLILAFKGSFYSVLY